DVATVLRAKLGIERPPLKILGACNPNLAHRALESDADAALMLPCNVVLEPVEGGTRVRAADPRQMMPGAEMAELATEAAGRLTAALSALPGAAH
ncbi:MAG TPA: DUF302 domain-containing protein, partial [Ilumatobacteraceae bacterium]|nr:DUF302 domain-containing protein [Ilumatobacteraceae bacterium]